MGEVVQPYADFEKLPLDFIVAAPLLAAIRAQQQAAQATVDFIKSGLEDDKTPIPIEFKVEKVNPTGTTSTQISVPLLAIVPVPHLRIDSVNINFQYEISQTTQCEKSTTAEASLKASTAGIAKLWADVSFSGSVAYKASSQEQMSRRGSLDIHIQASESPMPKGLEKILNFLTDSTTIETRTT